MFKISKKYYKSSLSEFKKEIKLIQSQKELLIFLALGFTIPQIAGKLNKTPNNIKKRTLNLYKKFDVHSRKELLLKAIEQKIIAFKNIFQKCRKRFFKSQNPPAIFELKIPKTIELIEKEYNFLLLFAQSYTRNSIMEKLKIRNMHECNYYYHCLLNKLNAKNALQAIVAGIKYGIIKI